MGVAAVVQTEDLVGSSLFGVSKSADYPDDTRAHGLKPPESGGCYLACVTFADTSKISYNSLASSFHPIIPLFP